MPSDIQTPHARPTLTPLAIAAALLAMLAHSLEAQPAPANYDESKIPHYTLPDPLVCKDGSKVASSRSWREKRRPELLEEFAKEMFGRTPATQVETTHSTLVKDGEVFGGLGVRRQIRLQFSANGHSSHLDLLIYFPKAAKGPKPLFLGPNFNGNHAMQADPEIPLSTSWLRDSAGPGVVGNRATEKSRGSEKERWPVEMILKAGYGVATYYYGDIDPDFDDGFKNGIHPLLDPATGGGRPADAWGSIGAWAWGLSRALDYIEKDPDLDARRVALLGHSRLGKTALWAGAQDERFAIVISNNSGCGGAALSKRVIGESVARINTSFPHWFCGNFKRYNANEEALPFDQHELIALIAPRPVYIASASEDLWADPKGEFLSGLHAGPVYALFGLAGLGVEEMPGVNKPVGEFIGYHLREGKHDVMDFDWEQYIRFANRHFNLAAAK